MSCRKKPPTDIESAVNAVSMIFSGSESSDESAVQLGIERLNKSFEKRGVNVVCQISTKAGKC